MYSPSCGSPCIAMVENSGKVLTSRHLYKSRMKRSACLWSKWRNIRILFRVPLFRTINTSCCFWYPHSRELQNLNPSNATPGGQIAHKPDLARRKVQGTRCRAAHGARKKVPCPRSQACIPVTLNPAGVHPHAADNQGGDFLKPSKYLQLRGEHFQ
jgi:hypothetical protein